MPDNDCMHLAVIRPLRRSVRAGLSHLAGGLTVLGSTVGLSPPSPQTAPDAKQVSIALLRYSLLSG